MFQEDADLAMDHLIAAASQGDSECLLKAAKAFETGINIGSKRSVNVNLSPYMYDPYKDLDKSKIPDVGIDLLRSYSG